MMKRFCLLLSLILVLSSFAVVSANPAPVKITTGQAVKVVEIFDGDAVAVQLQDGKIAYVRLAGVDASTSEGGMQYMTQNLLGNLVVVMPDTTGSIAGLDGRWNLAYIYQTSSSNGYYSHESSLNVSLIKFGFAKVDTHYKNISQYGELTATQRNAQANKAGVWGEGDEGYFYVAEKVNINTATRGQLSEMLTDIVTDEIVENIVEYRAHKPFNTIGEIKFVEDFTKEMYDDNRHLITVVTNINKATEKELSTLIDATSETVDTITKYRSKHTFSTLSNLHDEAELDRSFYLDNKNYMSVTDRQDISASVPDSTVNVNTASISQLKSVTGVSATLASNIVSARTRGYSYKTYAELKNSVAISESEYDSLEDNLHIGTDINLASTEELESLFGANLNPNDIPKIDSLRKITDLTALKNSIGAEKFEKISSVIYIDRARSQDRLNLNTATEVELRGIGLTYTQASEILSKQGTLLSQRNIPFEVSRFDKAISLTTNINTASDRELQSLHQFDDKAIVLINNYRNDQPFGSIDEVEQFFKDNNLTTAYSNVSKYIVVK